MSEESQTHAGTKFLINEGEKVKIKRRTNQSEKGARGIKHAAITTW